MNAEPPIASSQREVLSGLHAFVRDNLTLLLPVDQAWQPTDFLPDLTAEDLKELGVAQVFGLSTQDTDYQCEAAERLHLPFALLSDADLKLTHALNLPTFETTGMTLLKRVTLVLNGGVIEHVFYPVFPPDQSANEVIRWLANRTVPDER